MLFFKSTPASPLRSQHSVKQVEGTEEGRKEGRKERRKEGACTAHSCITHVLLHHVLQRYGGAELADLFDSSRSVVVVLPQPEVVAVGRTHHVGPVQQVSV